MKPILVSRCLLGERVRYDGDHCGLTKEILNKLKLKFEIIPVCPEVLAGLSIPRIPMELLNNKMISKSGADLTKIFEESFEEIRRIISQHDIQYALLKEQSPSCGVEYIYDGSFEAITVKGQGLATKFLIELGVVVYSELKILELLKRA